LTAALVAQGIFQDESSIGQLSMAIELLALPELKALTKDLKIVLPEKCRKEEIVQCIRKHASSQVCDCHNCVLRVMEFLALHFWVGRVGHFKAGSQASGKVFERKNSCHSSLF
jgi:hypothetical protein